ncbi:STAS/SEC14 domain-containing protein [Pseudonocardia oroxyli]|uniref:Uncharacterized protein n=1 Tax=Pseudonocardia oroxyli TaxID=366584 RepID=A0A1G7E5U2_PSEOR|nr:STAS/SEC14 domain-containing protein [Pseudonocardia oroxyli]SDE59057.1 hypothetical protein SAMN05216377_101263 [Pseudonocardia oroxyli]
MIEELVGPPEGVVGLRVGGRPTVEDHEKAIGPMVERIRFVVGHHGGIRRLALVGDTPVASTVAAEG